MIFSSQFVFRAVWIAIIFAQSGLLALLTVRKAYREYPAFVSFVSFCVARSYLLFYLARQHPALYQPVKWIFYVPQIATLIAVVLEVLHLLFHPFETLPGNTVAHFLKATGAVVVFAAAFAIWRPGAQATAWMTFATATDQVVSWVLCAVFVFVALFSTYFGIPWRHRLYGIGLGFLLYLFTDVAVTTAVTQFRLPPLSPIGLLDMLAFLAACLTWSHYFWRPETPRSVPTYEQIKEIRALLGIFAKFVEDAHVHGNCRANDVRTTKKSLPV